ncbi:hypothetical protein FG152_24730, partial [Ochrobactrum sp. XJ1]|nr:hypothetical protein [Ochrobactrum sp. XJ1]
PKQLITRTWPTLCNPGQRRAGQVLIRNRGVNIGQVKGVNIPFRLTTLPWNCLRSALPTSSPLAG